MKQPRTSTSQTSTKANKKPLLPTFRQSKTSAKVQEFSGNNKFQILFNVKLVPLQIVCERKNGEMVKITVNTNDIAIQEGNKTLKTAFDISSSMDLNHPKDWIQVNFGETFHTVKLKKIGDQNILGIHSNMVNWEKVQGIDKKINSTINVKDILKYQHKSTETITVNSLSRKEDQTKQMKAFVANLMSKKLNRRATEKADGQNRFSIKKKSGVFKNKPNELEQEINKYSQQLKPNPPSTAVSILSGISGVRSFRRDLLDKNLKQSKVTGKSEKQTSVGEQSVFLSNKLHSNMIHLSSLQNNDYERKKQKFDSQPYFYQKSTITSQFSNHNESTQKIGSRSRQEHSSTELLGQKLENERAAQNTQKIQIQKFESLMNGSQHQSEQEVEEDIKRSAMMNSSIKNQNDDSQFGATKKKKKEQESSECFESKQQLQSSGTIYQSKYQ